MEQPKPAPKRKDPKTVIERWFVDLVLNKTANPQLTDEAILNQQEMDELGGVVLVLG